MAKLAAIGAAMTLLCIWGIWKNWKIEQVLVGLFFLGSVWMPLCGPATECHTYLLFGPALVLALVQSFGEQRPVIIRAMLSLAYVFQLINHDSRTLYLFHFKQRWVFSAQPLSALLFLGYSFYWLINDSFKRDDLGCPFCQPRSGDSRGIGVVWPVN